MPCCSINLFQTNPNELDHFILLNYHQQRTGGMGTKVPLFILYLIPLLSSAGAVPACAVPPISFHLSLGPHEAVQRTDKQAAPSGRPSLSQSCLPSWAEVETQDGMSLRCSFMLLRDSFPIDGFSYISVMAQTHQDSPVDLGCSLFFCPLCYSLFPIGR